MPFGNVSVRIVLSLYVKSNSLPMIEKAQHFKTVSDMHMNTLFVVGLG